MSYSEAEIVRALETEKRMMERQQLLKELWKLNQLEESELAGQPTDSADKNRAAIEETGEPLVSTALSGQAI
jgi:hypothetical protein